MFCTLTVSLQRANQARSRAQSLVMCLLWKSHLLWINTPFTKSSQDSSWVRRLCSSLPLLPPLLLTPAPSIQPDSSSSSSVVLSILLSPSPPCLPFFIFVSLFAHLSLRPPFFFMRLPFYLFPTPPIYLYFMTSLLSCFLQFCFLLSSLHLWFLSSSPSPSLSLHRLSMSKSLCTSPSLFPFNFLLFLIPSVRCFLLSSSSIPPSFPLPS